VADCSADVLLFLPGFKATIKDVHKRKLNDRLLSGISGPQEKEGYLQMSPAF